MGAPKTSRNEYTSSVSTIPTNRNCNQWTGAVDTLISTVINGVIQFSACWTPVWIWRRRVYRGSVHGPFWWRLLCTMQRLPSPAFPHCTGNFQASFTFNIPYIEVTKYLTCLIQVLVYVCCDSIASLSLFSFHSPRVLVLADKLILQLHDLQVLGSMVS